MLVILKPGGRVKLNVSLQDGVIDEKGDNVQGI